MYTSEKKKKAFKQSKSQKAHFSLEMENKKFAMKKKTISLDLTNEDTIKSKRKKNMEIVKSENCESSETGLGRRGWPLRDGPGSPFAQ